MKKHQKEIIIWTLVLNLVKPIYINMKKIHKIKKFRLKNKVT